MYQIVCRVIEVYADRSLSKNSKMPQSFALEYDKTALICYFRKSPEEEKAHIKVITQITI